MIAAPTAAQQAAGAAIALAQGLGFALTLFLIAFAVKKLRLGRMWNAALQLVLCGAYFAFCLWLELSLFGGTFDLYRILCFCVSAAAGIAVFAKIVKKEKKV